MSDPRNSGGKGREEGKKEGRKKRGKEGRKPADLVRPPSLLPFLRSSGVAAAAAAAINT